MQSNLVTIFVIMATLAGLACYSEAKAASPFCQHDTCVDAIEIVYCSACDN